MTMKMNCPACGHRWEIQRSNYDWSCPRCAMVRQLQAAAYQRGQRDAERILKAREFLTKVTQPRVGGSGA